MQTSSPFAILQNDAERLRRHPHEGFSAARELEARLRSAVRGEIRFDDGSRALYATDASNYRQVPIGVVIPLDVDDVVATITACRELNAAVLSRGGGTSVAGQCCNVAVVLDFSKYMSSILDLDAVSRRARVQPGIVLDTLRDQAEKHQLTFAPDPATHSRCTLGGMIGNNACGVHALFGGKTVDNIESMDVLLYDGTRMRVGPTSEHELDEIIAAGGRRGQIYAGLRRLRDTYADLVRQRFPAIPRRVSGYNLDQLLPENGFNVARALVGSEGTCVTILEAECELKPSPQHRRLVVLGFADAFIAADHVPQVLTFKPIGLEGFDGYLVECMLRKHLAVDDVKLLPEGQGFLLCEFGADTAEDADRQAQEFMAAARNFDVHPTVKDYDQHEAERIWRVRESGLGASVFVPGHPSAWEGWEDSAVAPEKLGAFLRELFAVIERYGYKTPMYGHFGQGCVHLRMTFDFRTEQGILHYRNFIEEAADVTLKYGGSFSGEHGDGQSRAALLPKMFGPELMQAFREFKSLWDPDNRMNPGKVVDPIAVYDPIENLRFGAGYKPAPADTYFQYPKDGGSFSEATTRCIGVGACRSHEGTMCPSYMATLEEKHSTRGRAHLLWEMMQGDVVKDGWRDEAVREALEYCLSCKACKTECPTQVDMAALKSEFLAHYYEGRLHPLHHYAFGYMDKWASMASVAPRLANLPMKTPGLNSVIKSVLGIAQKRTVPAFAAANFRDTALANAQPMNTGEEVLLWPDTWNNYFHPQALHSAVKVLKQAGKHVKIPKRHVCCGRPLYDFGFLDEARRYLKHILTTFAPQIDGGMPVVMLEPSCATVFRDELVNFFPHDERAIRLSRQTTMLAEVLASTGFKPPDISGRRIIVHGHCHQKTQMTMKHDLKLLGATGASVGLLDSGCCGMAGPYGFEHDKYEISQTLANRVLLPAVRSAGPHDLIVSNGFSCREAIHQNSSRHPLHISQVLADDFEEQEDA